MTESKQKRAVSNKGYGDAGASQTKRALKGFRVASGSPREDIDYNNYTLRQRARILYMASPIAASGIKTSRTNAIGVGLQLAPTINREILGMSAEAAEKWEEKTKKEFALWAEDASACDALGLNDFYELQQLAYSSWLMSGDVFALCKDYGSETLHPYGLRLHLIEADRVGTPSDSAIYGDLHYTDGTAKNGNDIHDGVEVDSDGRVVAYYIRNTYPNELVGSELTKWERVEARGAKTGLPNILHVMSAERPDQYRGITCMSQIIEPILQLRRYTDAEIQAAVIQSSISGAVETETSTNMPFNESIAPGEEEVSGDQNEYEMGAGMMPILKMGEKMHFYNATHPNTSFDAFAKSICLQIGAALEIPRELLLKEFTASYSASRAALMEAWKSFKMFRKWFVTDFCQPVYRIWMTEAVARGRIHAPGFFTDPLLQAAWLGAEWIGPSQGMLDPTKEISAEILAVENGFSTYEQSTIRLNGGNWYENMAKLKRERQLMDESVPEGERQAMKDYARKVVLNEIGGSKNDEDEE